MADATIVRCSALVFGPDGQVLLVRRSRGPDPDYVLPGGTPRPGESLGACARREVREETGLEVNPVRVAFILETADGISGATVDESQTAGPLRAVEEGLCPEFVDLDRLGGCGCCLRSRVTSAALPGTGTRPRSRSWATCGATWVPVVASLRFVDQSPAPIPHRPLGTGSFCVGAAAVLAYLVGDVARLGPISRLEHRCCQPSRLGRVWPALVSASSETPVLALVVAGDAPRLERPVLAHHERRDDREPDRRRRAGAAAGTSPALGWGAATGAGQVLPGVHWPSDVLGALLLAAVWLRLLTALESSERLRQVRGPRACPGGEPGGWVDCRTATERRAS